MGARSLTAMLDGHGRQSTVYSHCQCQSQGMACCHSNASLHASEPTLLRKLCALAGRTGQTHDRFTCKVRLAEACRKLPSG